ncbi:MAG: hypothetical protein HY865_13090 [Chloroflexi bacterium]|nr:hypothetical protein [Chloroflexota bacterium]
MMQKQALPSNQNNGKWEFFLSFNIAVLFFFWIGVLTDYSWYDDLTSFLYSILVLCSSVAIFFMLRYLTGIKRILIVLTCLMSLLMGLASIPLHRYHSLQAPVQMATSPDGTRFVEVYCSFTSAHITGFDHIEITVRHKSFPFLQRDLGLYNDVPRHCDFSTNVLVRWEDNNTIYVVARQVYLPVGFIKGEGALFNPGEIYGTK